MKLLSWCSVYLGYLVPLPWCTKVAYRVEYVVSVLISPLCAQDYRGKIQDWRTILSLQAIDGQQVCYQCFEVFYWILVVMSSGRNNFAFEISEMNIVIVSQHLWGGVGIFSCPANETVAFSSQTGFPKFPEVISSCSTFWIQYCDQTPSKHPIFSAQRSNLLTALETWTGGPGVSNDHFWGRFRVVYVPLLGWSDVQGMYTGVRCCQGHNTRTYLGCHGDRKWDGFTSFDALFPAKFLECFCPHHVVVEKKISCRIRTLSHGWNPAWTGITIQDRLHWIPESRLGNFELKGLNDCLAWIRNWVMGPASRFLSGHLIQIWWFLSSFFASSWNEVQNGGGGGWSIAQGGTF